MNQLEVVNREGYDNLLKKGLREDSESHTTNSKFYFSEWKSNKRIDKNRFDDDDDVNDR